MNGLTREEMRALAAIQRIPEKLDAVTAAVVRLAEAVESPPTRWSRAVAWTRRSPTRRSA